MNRANLTQEYLAVTGACLMTKRALFNRIGGFDAEQLKIAYNDVDYCLSVHQLGYKVIYTPHARLFHYESKSRASDLSEKERDRYDKECIFMLDKWSRIYQTDPFFHPHLDEKIEDFRIGRNA
jgi:GT2 family glycosyltransferase